MLGVVERWKKQEKELWMLLETIMMMMTRNRRNSSVKHKVGDSSGQDTGLIAVSIYYRLLP